jgi:inosine-uridine nucleoside N-ribohydrolase
MKRKIIIDTDPGHDDALAIMLACKSPELEILAVTTVAGNSTIQNTTRNARFILDFLGRQDIAVFSGASKPLKRQLVQAVVHGQSGLDGADPKNKAKLTGDAVSQMLKIVGDNPGQVTIVGLGPLTNIAKAIKADPKTMGQVKDLVIMGGAVGTPGNKNRVAEFNFYVDPEAADIVMKFDVPKTMVPVGPCSNVLMFQKDLKAIKNKKLRELLEAMFKPFIANLKKDAGVDGAQVWDALTVFYMLQPESCKTRFTNIQIETKGEITRGMSVVDDRKVTDGAEPNVTVVTDIEAGDFVGRFVDALNGGGVLGGT